MTANIKTIIFSITSFVSGYGLSLLTTEPSTSSRITEETREGKLSSLLSQCESRNLELINRINKFVQAKNPAADNIATAAPRNKKQEKDPPAKEEDTQELKHQLALLRNYHLENELKKFQERLTSSNATPDNIPQTLGDNYQKDATDNHWAPEKKALLDDYIANNALFRSLPNVESDCKSKQCKISILSDDPVALANLAENLRSLTNSNDFSAYGITTDEKNHTTNIYLDRISTH